MDTFASLLAKYRTAKNRRWIYVPFDQLSDQVGPLARENPRDIGIILIESRELLSRRPYNKQKIALILANQRRFALEQADRGIAVHYIRTSGSLKSALSSALDKLGQARVMLPASRELKMEIKSLFEPGRLQIMPNEYWLTSPDEFVESMGRTRTWSIDAFYRHVRATHDILMEEGKPIGGKFSFESESRFSWGGTPEAPTPPFFPLDALKKEVRDEVERDFVSHPGRVDLSSLPCTKEDATALWSWAKNNCLHWFAPFQEAMSKESNGLFHTRLSALLNIGRLTPAHVLSEALEMDIPIRSKEAFIRQIVGWREFVHHVFEITDGFRELPSGKPETAESPGDAGYSQWVGKAREHYNSCHDGGAMPNYFGNQNPLPLWYWGVESGMACLDTVIRSVWQDAYSPHASRLMILSNIATLMDVSPRELTDWFWIAYADAYDWVVEPNVLGLGTYSVGNLMANKPYIAGAPYIFRMSDYCSACSFDPRTDCPVTSLYWAFLARHESQLKSNARMAAVLSALHRRSEVDKAYDDAVFHALSTTALHGDRIKPSLLARLIDSYVARQ